MQPSKDLIKACITERKIDDATTLFEPNYSRPEIVVTKTLSGFGETDDRAAHNVTAVTASKLQRRN